MPLLFCSLSRSASTFDGNYYCYLGENRKKLLDIILQLCGEKLEIKLGVKKKPIAEGFSDL